MTTFDRPVKAALIVRLDNGEEFEPSPDDLRKFGLIRGFDAYHAFDDHVSTVLRDAGAIDRSIIEAGTNPIRYLAELAINYPDLLTHPETASINRQLVAIERVLTVEHLRLWHSSDAHADVVDPFDRHRYLHRTRPDDEPLHDLDDINVTPPGEDETQP